ncbi:hypothetical protein [Colwellia sp. C1TZA3]|uniref:hypothetical protein n=1 Tax=Colwellia sp. C1TZA3 TaxID=2508879 RepID=UPI00174EA4BC|nr:hypothetical protein [Colwellia sp. C1TZA3]
MCQLKLVEVLGQLKTAVGLTEAVGYTRLAASEDELDRVTVLVRDGSRYAIKIAHY